MCVGPKSKKISLTQPSGQFVFIQPLLRRKLQRLGAPRYPVLLCAFNMHNVHIKRKGAQPSEIVNCGVGILWKRVAPHNACHSHREAGNALKKHESGEIFSTWLLATLMYLLAQFKQF